MIISSIDIGTNTVLLLIVQTDPKNNKIIPLLNEYRIPRIGKNVISSGEISPDSINNLKKILLEYKSISAGYKARHIIASATAAFRNAGNSKKVIDYIFKETGIKINIISPAEEARFAYLGVTDGLKDNRKKFILDIGGGSTEIIVGKNQELLYIKSFNTGVVTICETYNNNNYLIKYILNYFDEIFSDLDADFYSFDDSFAIAGTPTTLAAIKLNLKEFNESVDGSILTHSYITNFIEDYSDGSDYYLKNFGEILSGREDLIIPGALILSYIMKKLHINEIQVSTRGIRHGAVINFLQNYGWVF